jgi:hypothetical protein
MAACKYCGEWAGLTGDEHLDCARLAAEGKSQEEIRILVGAVPPATLVAPQTALSSLTPQKVFWTIFGALWAFSLSAGILLLIIRALVSAI